MKRTGDLGVVTRLLPDGGVEVYLPLDDLTLVAHTDDLEREHALTTARKPKPKAPPVFDHEQQRVDLASIKSFLPRFSPYDISVQLIFEPRQAEDTGELVYQTWLINATSSEILYEISLSLRGHQEFVRRGRAAAVGGTELGLLYFDELSDQPVYACEIREVLGRGSGPAHQRQIKLRPKQFMQRGKKVPLIDKPIHLYPIVETLGEIPPPTEDIFKYAERNTVYRSRAVNYVRPNEVQAYAEFPTECDLHIEKLRPGADTLPPQEILHLQLRAAERYLDRAIQLGVPRVFIIHGIGKGRLKQDVHRLLNANSQVVRFVNEHHPRYGWGATEVFL